MEQKVLWLGVITTICIWIWRVISGISAIEKFIEFIQLMSKNKKVKEVENKSQKEIQQACDKLSKEMNQLFKGHK